MNPRSNGMVECANRTIKSALCKFADACPNGHWWEVLGDIARSMRVLPTRALGYAPYVLVFKAPAPLAIHHEILQAVGEVNWDTAEQDLEQQVAYWEAFFEELRQK